MRGESAHPYNNHLQTNFDFCVCFNVLVGLGGGFAPTPLRRPQGPKSIFMHLFDTLRAPWAICFGTFLGTPQHASGTHPKHAWPIIIVTILRIWAEMGKPLMGKGQMGTTWNIRDIQNLGEMGKCFRQIIGMPANMCQRCEAPPKWSG